jgi:hypothetical protein
MLPSLLQYNLKRALTYHVQPAGRSTHKSSNSFDRLYRTGPGEAEVKEDHGMTDKDREYMSKERQRETKEHTVRRARGLNVSLKTCYFFL